MIEEIIKEVQNKSFIPDSYCEEHISLEDLFEILDKYDNQPDFKSAFEELKGRNEASKQARGVKNLVNELDEILKELEQKYNLGGE